MAENRDLEDLDIELPRDSYALIDLLDRIVPARCVQPRESMEAAQRYAGGRDLIDQLVEWKREEIEADKERSFGASEN